MAGTSVDRVLIGRPLGGRYLLRRLVGKGGMGAVYEATDASGARFAVKVLTDDDSRAAMRFAREARIAASIVHPNVVRILDVIFLAHEPPAIVMDLLAGETLRDAMARSGRLGTARAASLTLQMLEGLSAAHARGIVHRDMKPGNVFVTPRPGAEHVTILDFGIAKPPEDEAGFKTTTGVVLGTRGYMSPEQLLGMRVDARTDVFAVSVMLYEMLTGEKPDVLRSEPQAEVLTRTFGVPSTLAVVIERGLERALDRRWPDAGAMASALRAAASFAETVPSRESEIALSRPASGRSDVPSSPRRSSAARIAIGVALALLATFLGALAFVAARGSLRARPETHAALSASVASPEDSAATTSIAMMPVAPLPTSSVHPTAQAKASDAGASGGSGGSGGSGSSGAPRKAPSAGQFCTSVSAGLPSKECQCIQRAGVQRNVLCATANPVCVCSGPRDGFSRPLLCKTQLDARGHCPAFKYGVDPTLAGTSCTGYTTKDPVNVAIAGSIQCSFCESDVYRPGVAGEACTGFLNATGGSASGTLECRSCTASEVLDGRW